ncbi:aldehyde dehydrogenase family protein [Streptomyces sp. NPDC001530]|uniref:aldehyde dehydrogenase family protein n=1 Tax=Streptomyces sp. NPDC001530 TaxID=3364582 RepID=UPI0036A0DCA6
MRTLRTTAGLRVTAPTRDHVHREGHRRRRRVGGRRAGQPEGLETGACVRPIIFATVDPDSVIAQKEIFGPVLVVIPYDDDHAVAIANITVHGLHAAIAGEHEHALAIARRLRAGQVDIDGGQFYFLTPFGSAAALHRRPSRW